MNVLDYKPILSLAPAIPNGSQRSANVCCFWSEDGLEVMLETISPERTCESLEMCIKFEGSESDLAESVRDLADALVGALLWVHYPSIDWTTAHDIVADFKQASIEDVMHDYRAPFTTSSAADLLNLAPVIVQVLAQTLSGGYDLGATDAMFWPDSPYNDIRFN